MSKMLKSSGAMAAATMLSRILGMAREIVYASFMGAGMVAGAFQLAFQIPNLFRRLLGEGALTAAFIPIFKEKEKTSTAEEMWRAASAVISGLIAVASAVTVVVMLGITVVLASGYLRHDVPPQFAEKDVRDVRDLALRLQRQADPPSQFLWGRLSEPARGQVTDYLATLDQTTSLHDTELREKALRATFLRELNQITRTNALDPALFSGVDISPKTKQLLAENPTSEQRTRLNRLLLEDAYPQELTDSQRVTELMLRLLRFMFPYMLLICLTAVFMGMLNARGHFFIPAIGAVVMNTVMIASVYWLAPHLGKTLDHRIFALAIGVLVAGAAQAALQLPWLRADGFRYRWVSPWRDETVRRVVRQMIPGTIGVAAFQINMLVTQSIAFWVDPSIVAWFTNSVRLMELPQGVFGISLATYLLPTLSGLAAEKKHGEFRTTLRQGVEHLVFANLLASLLLCLLAAPIIRLLFEHRHYGPTDTLQASRALMCLAPGLVAFSLVNIFARAFYALGDTRTPMKISITCLGINLVLSLALIGPWRQAGMGIANTITGIINVCLLYFSLRRKMGSLELASLRKMIAQMCVAAAAAGAVAWWLCRWWTQTLGHAVTWQRLGEVFVPMAAAAAAYWALTLWFKVPPAMEIGGLLLHKFKRGGKHA